MYLYKKCDLTSEILILWAKRVGKKVLMVSGTK